MEVLYEDPYLAIINKPAGVEVSGNKKYTIENALPTLLTKSNEIDALPYPLPAHRLDYPTSGCLVIGKTTKTLIALNTLFEHKEITKKYLAITLGKQVAKGNITIPVDGKPASSYFKVLHSISSKKYHVLNLVSLQPSTGRRHQLRKHLAALGNPIFGEKHYGNLAEQGKGSGLYLQATSVSFKHPITKVELTITAPIHKKFTTIFPSVATI